MEFRMGRAGLEPPSGLRAEPPPAGAKHGWLLRLWHGWKSRARAQARERSVDTAYRHAFVPLDNRLMVRLGERQSPNSQVCLAFATAPLRCVAL